MRWLRGRRFGALLSPAGIHVVEYRQAGRGLQVARYSHSHAVPTDPAEAADRLADLLEAEGARHGRVALAVSGFGSSHHLLTLPAAPREVLEPVVRREMRRFYPELFEDGGPEPLVDFVEIDSSGGSRPAQHRELLVAAAPRPLLEGVHDALAARRIELEHWTVLPRALQRLHDAFAGPNQTDATVLLVPGAPLLGFFHEGELRLFSEPVPWLPGGGAEVDVVLEQIERGALFLRQQFRGATAECVLLAAAPGTGETERLREGLPFRVEPLGPLPGAPGALAALGAALDAGAEGGLNLLPAALRPRTSAELWTRALGVASAVLPVLAAAWWAASALRVEAAAGERVERLARDLRARRPAYQEVRALVEERRGHAQRTALLGELAGRRDLLPELVWAVASAPGPVRVTRLDLTPGEEGWSGTLAGTSAAPSGAEASGAVDGLVRDLERELGSGSLSLDRLAYADSTGAGAAADARIVVSFEMTFILAPPAEER